MTDDYEVGYGRPPKNTRFKKGASGNPKGRPKGTKNLKTDLAEELAERIVVKEGNQAIRISKQRALVKRLTAKGLNGDIRAVNTILGMIWRYLEPDAQAELPVDISAEDLELLESFVKRQLVPRDKGEES